MADTNRNALGELSERLKRRIAHHRYVYENQRQDDIMAMRIVAELAKVPFDAEGAASSNESWIAVTNSRAIAEEGVKDGK